MEDRITELIKEMRVYRFLPYYNDRSEQRYIRYKHANPELSWQDIITRVEIGLDHPYYTQVKPIQCPEHITVLVNKYRMLPGDYVPGDLEMIQPEYNDSTLLLRHEARIAFERMCEAAKQEGIILKAVSTFRSFLYQKQVYYRNMTNEMSLPEYQAVRDRVSARAGHSEHQTGLAVDINDLEQTFADTPEGEWLAGTSFAYGFILRYPEGKEEITGYDYEPWHFRYLGLELSERVHLTGLTYDEFYIRYLKKDI